MRRIGAQRNISVLEQDDRDHETTKENDRIRLTLTILGALGRKELSPEICSDRPRSSICALILDALCQDR